MPKRPPFSRPPAPQPMRVVAVKRTGLHERYYCTRANGSEVEWSAPSAAGLPHDLNHLVVESGLGIERGFWGLVAAGMNPAQRDPVRRFVGDDGIEQLLQAEAAVALLLGDEPEDAQIDALRARLAGEGVPLLDVSQADVERLRATATALAEHWEALPPGQAMTVTFPLDDPEGQTPAPAEP